MWKDSHAAKSKRELRAKPSLYLKWSELCDGKSNLLLFCLFARKYLGVKGCEVAKDYQHHKGVGQKDVIQV